MKAVEADAKVAEADAATTSMKTTDAAAEVADIATNPEKIHNYHTKKTGHTVFFLFSTRFNLISL